MKALLWWDVSNDVSKSSVLLDLGELFLKPLDLLAWIVPVVKKPPIEVVAGLHVDSNGSALLVERERLGIESIS